MKSICDTTDIFVHDDLIASHARWKMKLVLSIELQEHLDVDAIRLDDCCMLGKWLHRTDILSDIGHFESYKNCLSTHAKFHAEASWLAKIINEDKYHEAMELLDDEKSNYNQLSNELVLAIKQMENDITNLEKSMYSVN